MNEVAHMTPERLELIREAWARNRETGVRALRSGYPYRVVIPGPAMEVDLHFMGSELLLPPVAPFMVEHIEFTLQTTRTSFQISPQREYRVMCEGEEVERFSGYDLFRSRFQQQRDEAFLGEHQNCRCVADWVVTPNTIGETTTLYLTGEEAPPPPLGHYDICRARLKSLALLKSWLSPEQLCQYNKAGWFEVIGGSTGTCYRIHQPSPYNVARLDDKHEATDRLCVEARGDGGFPLAPGDIMLAQKIALEKNELPTLRVANWFTGKRPNLLAGYNNSQLIPDDVIS